MTRCIIGANFGKFDTLYHLHSPASVISLDSEAKLRYKKLLEKVWNFLSFV